MSAFDASAWIGARTVRPTAAQLLKISQYDPGLYGCGMDNLWRHVHYFQIPLRISAAVDNTTVTGVGVIARVPFKAVAVDLAVESAAGSAATLTIEKALLAAPTTWASMLEALVDVKTGAGLVLAGSVTSGKEDFAIGDRCRLSAVGTGSGAVVGSQAIIHAFRL